MMACTHRNRERYKEPIWVWCVKGAVSGGTAGLFLAAVNAFVDGESVPAFLEFAAGMAAGVVFARWVK